MITGSPTHRDSLGFLHFHSEGSVLHQPLPLSSHTKKGNPYHYLVFHESLPFFPHSEKLNLYQYLVLHKLLALSSHFNPNPYCH
jgi:hypothetical protein